MKNLLPFGVTRTWLDVPIPIHHKAALCARRRGNRAPGQHEHCRQKHTSHNPWQSALGLWKCVSCLSESAFNSKKTAFSLINHPRHAGHLARAWSKCPPPPSERQLVNTRVKVVSLMGTSVLELPPREACLFTFCARWTFSWACNLPSWYSFNLGL